MLVVIYARWFPTKLWLVDVCGTKQFHIVLYEPHIFYLSISIFSVYIFVPISNKKNQTYYFCISYWGYAHHFKVCVLDHTTFSIVCSYTDWIILLSFLYCHCVFHKSRPYSHIDKVLSKNTFPRIYFESESQKFP